MVVKRWMARCVYWPTLAYNYLLGRTFRVRNWWDRVDDHVILGARPFRRDAIKLQREGVTGVVNMCEEYSGPVQEYAKLNIEQLHLPTIDFNHPCEDFVEQGADFIERHARRGGKAYVHCKAGRARSATIALWWLVKYRHLSPGEAQQRLLVSRPHVSPRIYLRPVIQLLYQKLCEKSVDRLAKSEYPPEST